MERSLEVKPPSLKTGWLNRLVVTIGYLQPGFGQGGAEVLQDQLPLGGGGVKGNQVIVMERDAVGAQFAEPVDGFHRIQGRAGGDAERVGAGPAHGPEAER